MRRAISYLPNLLTLLRIGATPVVILLLKDHQYASAFLVFLMAGLSDGLDGYIAKRYDCVTRMGAMLDPVADKILLLAAYGMLYYLDHIPFWLVLTVGFRELLIVGGFLVLVMLDVSVQMQPSIISKLNTFLQITLVLMIVAEQAAWLAIPGLIMLLIYAVFATTALSGVHYLWVWGIRREEKSPEASGG